MIAWINKKRMEHWQQGVLEVIVAQHGAVDNLNEAVKNMHHRLEAFKEIIEVQNKRIEFLEDALGNIEINNTSLKKTS